MSHTGKSDHIRALDRGIGVIELLSRQGRMSLSQLRASTGLANATLLRVLNTLQRRNWVRRNIVEGQFELSHSLGRVLGESVLAHPLAEHAAPILLDLKGRQAGWPSDLCAVIALGQIEIVESTRLRGPMAPGRSGLGIRPSIVFSAHARAVLAFSSEEIARRHLDCALGFADRQERFWITSGKLGKEIVQTRKRGFGLREPNYWQPPFDPGPELGAIAVPIFSGSGLHGTLSLLWLVDDMSLDEILAMGSLDDLRRASARIGAKLDQKSVSAPEV